ncbi:unnamed protein product [Vicia faba]|uniref:Uncharacterized protein n=1 Tax=Vicia faba TaxID=3906 RepID=A0AAV1AP21_VICFA|nr:unnamed protein product [Vicia faba]
MRTHGSIFLHSLTQRRSTSPSSTVFFNSFDSAMLFLISIAPPPAISDSPNSLLRSQFLNLLTLNFIRSATMATSFITLPSLSISSVSLSLVSDIVTPPISFRIQHLFTSNKRTRTTEGDEKNTNSRILPAGESPTRVQSEESVVVRVKTEDAYACVDADVGVAR